MFKITKEFTFEASHSLVGLEEGHPCMRLHGHSYKVIVELRHRSLDETKFVLDYGKLKPIKEWIDEHWDHRHINDVMIGQPSAEIMAQYLFETFKPDFPMLYSVTVKETAKTSATYYID